jgi:hypothetical protein
VELKELCLGIRKSFVHLETRDAYGTETEQPHMAKWKRGEPDDLAWCGWWLEMMRGEYQRWSMSHASAFVDAGEDIRYVARPRLAPLLLPGSGDFYVFDDELVLFLHYAGYGINASYETTDEPQVVRNCREAFEAVWGLATPFREYRPE